MDSSPCFLRGPAMLVLWGAADPQKVDETALNAWWTNQHLPERFAMPGFLRMRRCFAADDDDDDDARDGTRSHYLVCYETATLDTLSSAAYLAALNHPTAETKRFMPLLAGMTRSACRVLSSTGRTEFAACSGGCVGATTLFLAFQSPTSADHRAQVRDWVVGQAWMKLTEHPTSLALHLLEHDDEATAAGSSSTIYDEMRSQTCSAAHQSPPGRWIVLVEFSESLNAPFGEVASLQAWFVQRLRELGVQALEARRYGLICAMSV